MAPYDENPIKDQKGLPQTPPTPTNDSSFNSLIAELSQLTSSSDHRANFVRRHAATRLADSPEGFYSVTSSPCTSRSPGSQTGNMTDNMTDSMSDLIITTGHEDLPRGTGSGVSLWHSGISGSSVTDGILQEMRCASNNQTSRDVTPSPHTPTDMTPSITHAVPIVSLPSKTACFNGQSATESPKNPQTNDVCLPSNSPIRLSALSPIFVPRPSPDVPARCDDASDASGASNLDKPVQDGIDGVEDMHQRYQFYSLLLSSSSAPSYVDISSAATDEDIFADDEYDYEDRLRVRMPYPAKRTFERYFPLPSGDSGLSLDAEQKWRPVALQEDVQTSRTLSPLAELVPSHEQQLSKPSLAGSKLQFPAYRDRSGALVNRERELALLGEVKKQLQWTSHGDQTTDLLATPKTSRRDLRPRNIGIHGEFLDAVSDELKTSPPASILKSKPYRLKRQPELELVACDTCEAVDKLYTRTRMSPCGHLACFSCLTASINIVGASGTMARCTCCHQTVLDFRPGQKAYRESAQGGRTAHATVQGLQPAIASPGHVSPGLHRSHCSTPVIMRIDNVAWDATPDMLEQFLPPGVLADTVQPVHILLVRADGRSKDHLFIEVKDLEAARRVLQLRQNAVLGAGSRARPVTITLSTEEELIKELTPRSQMEVMGLLELCKTAIERNIGHDDYTSREGGIYASVSGTSMNTQPTDMSRSQGESPLHTGKYLKSRYAPFWSVLSLASRVTTGHEVYWDLFHVFAGVISILAKHLPSLPTTVTSSRVHRSEQAREQNRASAMPRLSTALHPLNGFSQDLATARLNTSPEMDAQTRALNAKIRKRLEDEMARAKEQELRALRRKVLDAGGVRASKRKDWTRSDAKMLLKFVEVFESQFGVQVGLKQRA